jgi:hypothetical protein
MTLPALIPGASYHLVRTAAGGFDMDKVFRAEAGKTLDLGDVKFPQKK